jgi:hypothetical protein
MTVFNKLKITSEVAHDNRKKFKKKSLDEDITGSVDSDNISIG